MAFRQTFSAFLQRCKGKKISCEPESSSQPTCSSTLSRVLDIEEAQRAERAALTQHAERLCASQKAQTDAVLERLGLSVQHDTLSSPQPSVSPRGSQQSSLRGRRIRPIAEDKLPEDDPFFEKKLYLGSQMAIFACKAAKLAKSRSPSPVSSIGSADTPTELRSIPFLSRFTPTPPPAPTRKPSRIPVMTLKLGEAGKEVGGRRLKTVKPKVEGIAESLEKIRLTQYPSPKPPAAPRRTPAVARKVQAPSSKAAPPKRQELRQETREARPKVPAPPPKAAPLRRREIRQETTKARPKVPAPPPKAAPPNKKAVRRGTSLRPKKAVVDIQPLTNPSEGLSMCFKQLESEEWEKKMEGLKIVQALARHHSALLQTKLHEICLVLAEEVNNLRSTVAIAAMDTVGELHAHLGRAMDPEAERTGRALLLKLATTTNVFIHQQANLALDTLVNGCSPGRIITFLVNTGLNHRCAAVRASTAQHLHQLTDIVGEDQTLTVGKVFAERYLTAVSKMAVDAAPEVRHHGQAMLQGLVHQREFIALWDKVVPVADRRPLQKILQKMRQ